MAKSSTRVRALYRCSECGWETVKWVGRCGECQAWGSVAEAAAAPARSAAATPVTTPAVPIGQVSVSESAFRSSGVGELDRVLGGGLVPGAAILLAGEPGVGKSTLLLEVAASTAAATATGGPRRVLYITGEESASQVRLRADRTGGVHDELYLAAETDLGAVLTHIEQVRPQLIVVDSVQTIAAPGTEGVPGGVTQVKEVAAALIRVAKTRNITTVLVGHVTKDGSIAGPRVLEHLVDVVLHFEGDRESRFRMVRAMKNRFGPVDEVGCFDLSSTGIRAVTDPTGLFVEDHHGRVSGTCVAVTMEGRRPLLAEVQALVTPSPLERPRRTVSGLDGSRIAMVLAVLQQHAKVMLHHHDVFASTVGGARLSEPASDLAVAAAIVSATTLTPPPVGVVAMGEIGLAGELRRVRDLELRVAEAARLGFKMAVVPMEPGSRRTPRRDAARMVDGLRVVEAPDAVSALRLMGLLGTPRLTLTSADESMPSQRPR
ncbi:DNA repair protein RadA [Nocardioides sp. AX2bis]|uniref:DNA repair protein RadA n=1 Tax=Nocardioides sp. AX2bis TaxID=2653157 RepID=UPI0012F11C5B|nr:DNA repair protein RadA [Nocardioides sp. AX2bis]VXC21957.1 DNA repair protein; 6-O-methylguanine-DNA methyltransferase [Nocardioides sp. AX2bis]